MKRRKIVYGLAVLLPLAVVLVVMIVRGTADLERPIPAAFTPLVLVFLVACAVGSRITSRK